jgi:hypothetical protein
VVSPYVDVYVYVNKDVYVNEEGRIVAVVISFEILSINKPYQYRTCTGLSLNH